MDTPYSQSSNIKFILARKYFQIIKIFNTYPLNFTVQKMKFSIKDFLSKCDQIRTADLVTLAEEILNGKLNFMCSVIILTKTL